MRLMHTKINRPYANPITQIARARQYDFLCHTLTAPALIANQDSHDRKSPCNGDRFVLDIANVHARGFCEYPKKQDIRTPGTRSNVPPQLWYCVRKASGGDVRRRHIVLEPRSVTLCRVVHSEGA